MESATCCAQQPEMSAPDTADQRYRQADKPAVMPLRSRGVVNRVLHAGALVSADIVAAFLASGLAFKLAHILSELLRDHQFVSISKAVQDRAPFAFPVLLVCALWMHSRGHYGERIPFWSEVRDVISAAGLCLVAEGFIEYAAKEHVSRLWVAMSWGLYIPICVLVRSWMKWALTRLAIRRMDVFLFGDPEGPVRTAIEAETLLGFKVVGASVDADAPDAAHLVRRSGARMAVIAMGGDSDVHATSIAHHLSHEGVPFALCPPLGGLGLASMRPLVLFGHDAVLLVERRGLDNPIARILKRLVDIVCSLMALLVLGPIAAAFSLVVALDGGNPFYAQTRIGRRGRMIRVWKIRSMVIDADVRLAALLESDPVAREEWARDRKLKRDPRITRVGRFMRTSAVDEIPQLWNVLAGEMSLVGPRPVVAAELERYGDAARIYLGVNPGLTGLWQVSGRNDTTYERRIELDAWYVRNWSLWIDAVVLMKTIPALLVRRGAY